MITPNLANIMLLQSLMIKQSTYLPWLITWCIPNHRRLEYLLNRLRKTIKALHHWPLWEESTGDWWITLTKDQWCEKSFHLMKSSCISSFRFGVSSVLQHHCNSIKITNKMLQAASKHNYAIGFIELPAKIIVSGWDTSDRGSIWVINVGCEATVGNICKPHPTLCSYTPVLNIDANGGYFSNLVHRCD